MSSRDTYGVAGGSQGTASTANVGLTKNESLYRTFTPTNAGWNLQDFAWDKQAHRVASREDIAAAARERRERDSGTDSGSAGRVLHSPRPTRPPALAKLAAKADKARGAPGRQTRSDTEGTSNGKAERQSPSTKAVSSVPPAPVSRRTALALEARAASSEGASGGSIGSAEGSTRAGSALKPGGRTRGGEKREKKISSATKTDDSVFSRRCSATPCEGMCQPSSKRRVERVLCAEHGAMRDVPVENVMHRFCQVCYALHPTSAFKSTNRTCNAVLARKRMLRVQRQKKRLVDVDGEEDEREAEAEEAPAVSASRSAPRKSGARARKEPSSDAKGKRETLSAQMWDAAPALFESGDAGVTAQTEAAEPSGGAGAWLWSSLGLASGAAPAAKRARGIGSPASVAEEMARAQMILDMEHGALGSAQITSAAIKIPYASPAYLSRAAGGDAAAPADSRGPHVPATMEHEMNTLLQWMDQAPVRAPTHRGESHPAEDFGTDPFIRPGSLIYGVHSQGVVTDVGCAGDDADDADEPVAARTRRGSRHNSRSMLRALASPEKGGGRLLRNAAAALRENALPESAALNAKGDANTRMTSLDASGDGLLRIPEGVFGSFNGEICRLDVDEETGETVAVRVKNTPYGFSEGVLAGSESLLDSAAPSATLTLPFVPAPGTQMVCMFQGAHLPLRVEPNDDGSTNVSVLFHPSGGYHAAAEWALNGGEPARDGMDGDAGDGVGRDGVVSRTSAPACTRAPPPLLEGTASLEMLITEGPMRGLPVGRVLPLLLSPDAELRREVASALRSLEHNIAHREVEVDHASVDAERGALGVLPEPVALVSMLGAVLHAVGKNQEPNPRMHRGAVAMANYFLLKRVAARLGEDATACGRIASPADVTALMRTSVRAALAPRLSAFLAALVAAVIVTAYAKFEARAAGPWAAENNAWVGIGASAAAVAISAGLVACLARVSGLPERQGAL